MYMYVCNPTVVMLSALRLKRKRNEKITCCFPDGGASLPTDKRGTGKDTKIENQSPDSASKSGNISSGM